MIMSDPAGSRQSGTFRYPRYDLATAEEAVQVVLDRGGKVSNPELAALLGYKSANNGAYMQKVAATRLFGLLDGQGQSLTATTLARDILQPRSAEGAARARLIAFENVPLFADFLDEHEARQLPPRDGLVSEISNKYGLGLEPARLAHSRMMSSARHAGLFAMNDNMMIRPTIREVVEATPIPGPGPWVPGPASNRAEAGEYPLFIIAALAEVPWNTENEWTDDDLSEWMEWFERGMRVHLKLPRSRHTSPVTSSELGQS